MKKKTTPERITAGPEGKLKISATNNPIPVIKIPKITLNPKNDFKLHAIFRAEVAGKIVNAPISTEPISFIPKATLKAKSKRNPR